MGVARAHGYLGDMKLLPREQAIEIYTTTFWTDPRFNQVALLSQPIAEELLDTGVNMGPATATKFLQRALNTLDVRGKLFPAVVIDGALGAMSIGALRAYLDYRGVTAETVMLKLLNAQQNVRYMEIAEKNQTQEDFMFGWVLNRG
jgi:lysozyme family protein